MTSLAGKKALVTGASGGIGGAIAKALINAGADVAISGTRLEALEASVEDRDRMAVRHVHREESAHRRAHDRLGRHAHVRIGRGGWRTAAVDRRGFFHTRSGRHDHTNHGHAVFAASLRYRRARRVACGPGPRHQ